MDGAELAHHKKVHLTEDSTYFPHNTMQGPASFTVVALKSIFAPEDPRTPSDGSLSNISCPPATLRAYIGRVKNLNSGSPDTLNSAATQIP